MRKKLTMLLASLFLVMGTAWADAPKVGQRYRLKNVTTGLYMQANGSSNLQLQKQKYSVLQFFSVEDAGDGKFYLKSETGANKYVNASGWDAVIGSGDNKTAYTVALVNGESDVYTLDQVASDCPGKIGSDGNTAGSVLYCNKGEGNNGKWQFEAVANPVVCTFDPTKTYRIKSEYSGLYMQLMTTGTSGATEGAFKLKDKSVVAEGQKFMFEAATDGKYYLKTVKDGTTYYVNQGSWNFHAGSEATTPFEITVVDGHTAVYSFKQTVDAWNSDMHGYAGNGNEDANSFVDGTNIYCNQSLKGNTIWSFEEVLANDPCNITELSQLDNNSYYKIFGERGFIFGADGVVKGTNVVSQAYSEGNKDLHFAIIKKDDKYYLYNVGAKKFVVKDGNNTKLVDLPEQPITLEKTSDKNYVWFILLNGTYKINLSRGYNDYGVYTDYNTEDPGNRWVIYKAGTFNPTEALDAFNEPTNLYALQSSKEGTYFSFTAPTDGTSTKASFQATPTYFYKVASDNGYTFEDFEVSGRFIGLDGGWNVGTSKAFWNISEADGNGYVTISRNSGTGNLGHNEKWRVGTGIFTNVNATCNKWKLIRAYPITVKYMCAGEVLETVTATAMLGESYIIDTKEQDVLSCETNKGEVVVTDGVYSIPAVNGATEVTVTFKSYDKYENSIPEFKDESSTIRSNGQYLNELALDGTTIFTDGTAPASAKDMYVLLNDLVVLTPGDHTFTPTFPNNKTSHILSVNLWFDKDGDGTFETHLGTTGAANSNSNNLSTIAFTIPNDATPGLTRIRFRLDSSWGIAATADAVANRMVYDIPVEIKELPKASITYNLIYNGESVGTQTISATVGFKFPAPGQTFKMGNALLKFELPEGTVPEEGGEYDVNVNIEAAGFPTPTTVVDGQFAADTKWYFATLRGEYIKYNGTTIITVPTRGIGDDELFAITGDIKDGYHFYNKALGVGKVIYSNEPKELDNANPTPVDLTENPTGSWFVTSNSKGGFSFAVYYNNKNYYLHEKNDVLSYWGSENSTSDAGSSLVFSPAYEYSILVKGLPQGNDAEVKFDGATLNNESFLAPDYIDVDRFSAKDIEGYVWKYTLNDRTITLTYSETEVTENPEVVVALVNRIGGAGTAKKFRFVLDPSINSKQETFVLGTEGGKILIKGSTISAITTGLGWYLNNVAHINIAWNSLNEKTVAVKEEGAAYADLSKLPLPQTTEMHSSDAKYRYYLNYCTFGYSMTSWTWTRWQQEIDWMALHGVNMPLQLVGLEEVWRTFLTMKDDSGNPKYGYTDDEAKAFVAGPAFTAWWGMNNLEGWGGTNADGKGGVQDNAWYARQKELAGKIVAAQRALGMQPVLPGWSGMVPTNFNSKSGFETRENGGYWVGGFVRPLILSVNNEEYADIAADYYACLKEVMGESQYYSMDPFHEGGGTGTTEDYEAMYAAMEAAKPSSQWVIQQWQWKDHQKLSLNAVPEGKLIVLDLFSDGSPAFDGYNGYAPQDAVFCAIPNFGGRSGLMGRLQNVTDNYFEFKAKYKSIKGIGTAPEAIEQTPVTYDLIYQLSWMGGKPNVEEWVDNYAYARYGQNNAVVREAWSLLRQGPLNYGADGIQGPVEDVWAARPNLDANKASSWGVTLANAGGTYTLARRQMLIDAVYKLIDQEDDLALASGTIYRSNYLYDLVEFGGAVMADYAYDLLLGIKAAKNAAGAGFANNALYKARRDAFLQLILDMDAFRGTNLNFRLGKWTQEARDAAKEAKTYGATIANEDWYEYNNARTILTTWSSPGTDLTDYSYRSWQGLLKDYYLPRWEYYFNEIEVGRIPNGNAYKFFEWNWAHGMTHKVGDSDISTTPLQKGEAGHTDSYTREPVGNTMESAKAMLPKYIIPIQANEGTTFYAYRYLNNDLTDKVTIYAEVGTEVDFTQYFDISNEATIEGSVVKGNSPVSVAKVPVLGEAGTYTATITLLDGTVLQNFTVVLKEYSKNFNGYYNISYNGTPMFIGYNEADDWQGDEYRGYKMLGECVNHTNAECAYHTNATADKVFAIVPQGEGYTIAAQGMSLKAPNFNGWNHVQFSGNKADAGMYLFNEEESLFKIKAVVANDGVGGPQDHLQVYDVNGELIVAPNPETVASLFTITPVTTYTVNIPVSGYLPICLPFNVVLPQGIEAFDVELANLKDEKRLSLGNVFTSLAVAGETLKAGTPVILKGVSGEYTLDITMSNSGAKTSLPSSVLCGNFVKKTLKAKQKVKRFVLKDDMFDAITGLTEIPANSCWIAAEIGVDDIDLVPKYINVADGWKFRVKKTGWGLTIVECVEQGKNDVLEIGEKYKYDYEIDGKQYKSADELEIIAISDQLLAGNEFITEVHFPKTLTSVGMEYANYMFDMSYWGVDDHAFENVGVPEDTGTDDVWTEDEKNAQNAANSFVGTPHACKYNVLGTSTWRMTVEVTKTADTEYFNDFGSCLFATKENTLANDYNDGSMQLYLRERDNGIAFKLNSTGDTHVFNEGNKYGLGGTFAFTFVLVNDGAGGYKATMTYDDGTMEEFEILATENAELHDFNTIWSSLGTGIYVNVKFEKLTNKGLFADCVNLKKIVVDEENPSFMGCDHGVLYNKSQTHLVRFPEDGGHAEGEGADVRRHFSVPYKVTMVYAGALHGVDADIVFHSNPLIMYVKGHEDHMMAKYYLSLDDDSDPNDGKSNYAVDFVSANANTYVKAHYRRAPIAEGSYGTITLPFVPTNAMDKYDFYEFVGGNTEKLFFDQVDELQVNTPYLYKLKENPGDILEDGLDVFETKESFTVKYKELYVPIENEAGCKAVATLTNNSVEVGKYSNSSYYYYSKGKYSDGVEKVLQVTKKLNYRPYRAFFVWTPEGTEETPAQIVLSIARKDGTVTEIESAQVEGWDTPVYYDLMGRLVKNPTNGIYIVNGIKVLVK